MHTGNGRAREDGAVGGASRPLSTATGEKVRCAGELTTLRDVAAYHTLRNSRTVSTPI